MDFESHSFGIKIAETDISVELIESLGELSKYQFILSDKITNSYNGNTTYGINIQQLTTQEHIEFFGWKLISLSFSGNWYGEWGVWTLEDLYGKRKNICATGQAWYHKNKKELIEMSIKRAKEFAENNYSADYSEIIEKTDLMVDKIGDTMFGVPSTKVDARQLWLLPVNNKISLKGFTKLISSTKQYIEDYQKILISLSDKEDERSILLIDTLKKSFSGNIKKYYPFEIEDLSKSK